MNLVQQLASGGAMPEQYIGLVVLALSLVVGIAHLMLRKRGAR